MVAMHIGVGARWSGAVIRNNMLYHTDVSKNLDAGASEQTTNTLARIDAILERQNNNKPRILDATLFLADENGFTAMNKTQDTWAVAGHMPVRCIIQARLMNPKYKVEIRIVTAV